jgi:hypothetical protein
VNDYGGKEKQGGGTEEDDCEGKRNKKARDEAYFGVREAVTLQNPSTTMGFVFGAMDTARCRQHDRNGA